MKFRASYFSISIPLIKENLRRFWAIPAIGFLAYFLSGVFPILMSYSNINNMYYYIEMCLTNKQPFFMAIHLMLPIITAVIVYRYLQSPSSVTSMHAMPFTRAQLFNSGLLSGLILILLPLLGNELIFQLIAKPTYDYYMYEDYKKMIGLMDNAVDIFTRSNVLEWFWQSLLIVLVIYAISIFAGMVTGNTVMHLSLALGFNFLAPALYLTFITYCSSYLFGFASEGIHMKILTGLSPFIQSFNSDKGFAVPLQIYYIILTILVMIVSSILYQKRQMEKSGDSIVFKFMVPAICYLIAYFGMSLMAYYFTSLGSNNNNFDAQTKDIYFYAGLAAGAIISFILGRMIVLKTPRIFNRQTLKSFGIFALIAILFICSITLDLTGFEKRVPHSGEVHGVLSTAFNYADNNGRYNADFFNPSDFESENSDFYYSDPKNIKALIALHQDIVSQKQRIEKEQELNVQTYPVDLYYDNSTPLGLQRSYTLTYKEMLHNKYFKQLYESQEFKRHFSFKHLNCEKMTRVTLNNLYYYDENVASRLIITEENKITELLAAMEQDFQARTYENYLSLIHPYCNLYLDFDYLNNRGKIEKDTLDVNVLLTDTHTINWLKDNGYSNYLECSADKISKIVFTKQDSQEDITSKDQTIASKDMTEEENKRQLIITDPDQIRQILSTYCTSQNNFDTYYQGHIVYKQIDGATATYSDNIYYDLDTAPDFISGYFH